MKKLIGVFVLLLMTGSTLGQKYEWWPGGSYDPEIPTPESVLGYEIGTFLTDHLQMVDYINRLSEASDRVKVIKYGQSVERRDMYLLVLASPDNLARIEEIRQAVQKLADPRVTKPEEAERIIQSIPPIAWLNCANDGGETAAFEVGIQMAYQLAAGTDEFTRNVLENLVVIINTAANPDSHQRFVAWMKAVAIGPQGTADPHAMEHNLPWFLSSDGNHYLIDSNRDAFALSQVETQAVAKVLHHWKPQVWVDNHGEPDEYYFAPFCTPMNLNYPEELRGWATELGEKCAEYFDRMGWSYARDETYDLFYPGYWDSYPAFNGAVSATFETNGGGWKHLSWEKPDGTLATLRLAVHGHFMTNMATLELLVENRRDLLQYFYDFHKTGMEEVKAERVKGYALLPGQDQKLLLDLVGLLMRHEIEVYEVGEMVEVERGKGLTEDELGILKVPAGSFLVPLEQPKKRLAKALLEPTPEIEEEFLAEVERMRDLNRELGERVPKERLGFYDVTTWSLPLAFGLEAAEIESELPLADAELLDSPPVIGVQLDREARYAYLFSCRSVAGQALAGRLLQEGFTVGVSTRSFSNDQGTFHPGDFVVRVERNPGDLHRVVSRLVRETGAQVKAVDSAASREGISLGSTKIINLQEPRIMVFTDDPTQAVAFGAVYSLLEQRFGLKFTAVRAEYFSDVDLSRYNVIILPDGSASGYRRLLGDSGTARLIDWIRRGGAAIGIKGAALYLSQLEEIGPDLEFVSRFRTSEDEPWREIENHPGSIYRAEILNEYFLGYGYPGSTPVQVRGSSFMTPTQLGVNVVSFPPDSHLGGHKWEYTEEVLSGKSYLADLPVGSGHLILFAEDPTFRAYWRGLDRLFVNGILLAPSF